MNNEDKDLFLFYARQNGVEAFVSFSNETAIDEVFERFLEWCLAAGFHPDNVAELRGEMPAP